MRRDLVQGLTAMLLLVASAAPAYAEEEGQRVLGLWAGPSSIIEIAPNGEGLSATVRALKDPLFRSGEAGPEGQPVTDINNPDPDLRSRPAVGLNLLSNYQLKGGKWQGDIYDPESGKTYSSNMRVDRKGELLMRGYIGTPLFGRTARFVPLSRCTALIKRMLASAAMAGCEATP